MTKIIRSLVHYCRVLLFITRPFSITVLNFIYRICIGKSKPLPPIDNNILLISATQLAEKIRKRQLKCEDVMRAYVERCRAVNPLINAIVDARYEDALEESRLVDRFLERGEKSHEEIKESTPLLGVPFTCKEAIGVKGLTQTAGIVSAKGRVAPEDSDSAAMYRAAGAIPVTVTNVPELCMWYDSSNLIFGVTKNPYDHSRTPGGSSGGESSILGAAGAVIGIGNDLAGSIRMPSSFCGIYGHKPTRGIVSNFGDFPYDEVENKKIDPFVSTGPMCRYAEDLPLLLKILSGDDKRLRLQDKVDFRKVKVYYIEGFPGRYMEPVPDIKKSIKKAVSHFEEEFEIKPIPLKMVNLGESFNVWECKMLETDAVAFKTCLVDQNGNFNFLWELVKKIFRLANHTLVCMFYALIERREKNQYYYDCLKKYDELERQFQEIFEEDAIVLLPTHPEPPPHLHVTIPKLKNIAYTAIYNILGFPVTNIPAGMCDGLPIGIQAVSGYFKDHLTIAAALELDKLFHGWKSPCPINV